jgi:hypothetical protein
MMNHEVRALGMLRRLLSNLGVLRYSLRYPEDQLALAWCSGLYPRTLGPAERRKKTTFDDGLSAVISTVMRCGPDYRSARTIAHALHDAGYLA